MEHRQLEVDNRSESSPSLAVEGFNLGLGLTKLYKVIAVTSYPIFSREIALTLTFHLRGAARFTLRTSPPPPTLRGVKHRRAPTRREYRSWGCANTANAAYFPRNLRVTLGLPLR